MLTRRNWVLRLSIVLNLVVLFYFGTHIASRNGGSDFIEELQAGGRNLASLEMSQDDPNAMSEDSSNGLPRKMALFQQKGNDIMSPSSYNGPSSIQSQTSAGASMPPSQGTTSFTNGSRSVRQSTTVATVSTEKKAVVSESAVMIIPPAPVVEEVEIPEELTKSGAQSHRQTLQELIRCNDRTIEPRTAQRGDYWVLYNYVISDYRPHCWETLTYTTHADYTFLDNLEPLLERWRGPVSLALFAPGTDFIVTLNTIRYLKDCGSPLVNQFVTFHIYFPTKHIPKQIPKRDKILEHYNCTNPPPWVNATIAIYKSQKKLLYPVNVGRNIARESAVTHYILPSDIELYPSPGLITNFLDMIQRQDAPLLRKNPKVFALSIFELEINMNLPANKKELVSMVKNGTAIPFHKMVCPGCHNVPKAKEWLNAPSNDVNKPLKVFHIGKRTGYFVHWEPIFIGTHQDPLYDERLSWEGKSDKMTQGYTLCVLDYEFQILDNAFLVHKPGIKTLKKDSARAILAGKTNILISRIIFPELKVLYGTRKGCAV